MKNEGTVLQTEIINNEIADLIPIACHYNQDTILTKQGDLIQILRITGFEDNEDQFDRINIRDAIRKAIKKHIPSADYAVYFHILRNERDIMPQSDFELEYAVEINKRWCAQNNWDRQLRNVLYISIVKQGPRDGLLNLSHVIQSTVFKVLKTSRLNNLENMRLQLNSVVEDIRATLSRYNATKLTIKTTLEGDVSEPLSFFYNIIHLDEKDILFYPMDTSLLLSDLKLTEEFNTLVVKNNSSTKYAAVYTVKFPSDYNLTIADDILQIDAKFIISEVILFTDSQIISKEFAKHEKICLASKAETDNVIKELQGILNQGGEHITDFCQQQVTITIYGDNKEKFELGIKKAVEVFTSIGIVVVREDFFMPMCFWSQLPGNFRYIARKSYNATSFVGAFNSIHHKHIGLYNGSIWGPPVSIFKNFNGRPYYFNFHTGKNGNTLVIGPKGSGKSTLVKFLLTQSLKLKPRIVYINVEDLHGSEFMDAINGKTLTVKSAVNSEIKIDIFNVANFENNFEFFENTLWDILSSNRESMASEKNSFSEMLKQLADIKQKDQREAMLKEYIEKNKSLRISEALKALLSSDFYNFLLNEDSVISVDNIDILNIDLTSLYNAERLADEFIGLILIKLQKILDQRLTIISLNHCHEILCSDVFSKVLPKWLGFLTENNGMAIFSTESSETLEKSNVLKNILGLFSTQFYLSNKFIGRDFKKSFALSEWEVIKIKSYNTKARAFLMKRFRNSIVTILNLKEEYFGKFLDPLK